MKWVREASESKSIWPYRVQENAVQLEVSLQLHNTDGTITSLQTKNWTSGAEENSTDSFSRLDLFSNNGAWSFAELTLSVSVADAAKLKQMVLPAGVDAEFLFAIFLKCPLTRWRKADTKPFGDGKADFQITLKRADVAGEVEISPQVVLKNNIIGISSEWAKYKASRVSIGIPIYVQADRPDERPAGGLEIKWEKFEPSNAKALYQLDMTDLNKPVLRLNELYKPELGDLMVSKSQVDNNRTLIRDSMNSFIALDVWMQLVEAASKKYKLLEYDENEDEIDENEPSVKILEMASRRIKWDRNKIVSSFDNSGSTGDLRMAFQNYLAVGIRQVDMVKGVKTEDIGGD